MWDKVDVKGPLTVQGFIDHFAKTYGVQVSIISSGKVSMYNKYSNTAAMKERSVFKMKSL